MLEWKDHFFQLLCSENIHLRTEKEKLGSMNNLVFSSKLKQLNPWEEVISSMYLPSTATAL